MTKSTGLPLLNKLDPKRSIEMMGALYEDVEKFFGDIFAYYARFVIRYPVQFVLVPLVICGLLGLGLLNIEYEFRVEKLYTPVDGKALRDKSHIKGLFPEERIMGDEFYSHQQVSHGVCSEIIVTCKNDVTPSNNQNNVNTSNCYRNNILSKSSLEEVNRLYDYIVNLSVMNMTYLNLCAKRNDTCVVNGKWVLDILLKSDCLSFQAIKGGTYAPNDPYNAINDVLANVTTNRNGCVNAIALKLRFNLRQNGSNEESIALTWENKFLQALSKYRTNYIDIAFTVSESMDIDIRDHVGHDTKMFLYSVIAMLVYATVVGAGGNWVSNHVTLAYAGVLAALMSVVASLGFLSLCGMKFVNMCGVMPFLIIGVGADDMFQLMTEWRQTNVRDTLDIRMSRTMRSAAVSITITSLTDILAFCIGATSPFLGVKNFCACSGVAILFSYFNQLTFFSGCLVLHARRVASSRHCVTCLQTRSIDQMDDDGSNSCCIVLCSGQSPQKFSDEGGICRPLSKYFYMIYPKFLLNWVTKTCVIITFGIYLCASIWGVSMLKRGFRFEEIIPDDSYLSSYISKHCHYFPNSGPVVMFVITKPIDYHKITTMKNLKEVLERAEAIDEVVPGSTTSWLDQFDLYLKSNNRSLPKTEKDFITTLERDFLPGHPQFLYDVKINAGSDSIEASRFYVLSKTLNNSQMEANLLIEARKVANSSPYTSMTAYSPQFIYFEQYVTILKDTLLAVGVTMIGLLFVALVFIPHPIAVSCVTVSMVSVVLGMMAFMSFWGLELSAITTIQIILCVALCVDSTVHMSHAFMTATGKNRNERVTVALEKVGIPILNAAFSSFLGISMLALGDSYIFKTFFKTLILVIFLSLLHSIIFLPVMLSFIGPRRTSKPRVFIPVSPSVRSLQDTYRANSIPCPASKMERLNSINMGESMSKLTRSHSLSEIEGPKHHHVEGERRVSFAVGEESKYGDVDPSVLRISVDTEEFPRKSSTNNNTKQPEMEVLLEQCEESEDTAEERDTPC